MHPFGQFVRGDAIISVRIEGENTVHDCLRIVPPIRRHRLGHYRDVHRRDRPDGRLSRGESGPRRNDRDHQPYRKATHDHLLTR